LSSIIRGFQAWHAQRMRSFSKSFEDQLVAEISFVFDSLDTEKMKSLGPEHLVTACKQL
jgi:hypothetical protein